MVLCSDAFIIPNQKWRRTCVNNVERFIKEFHGSYDAFNGKLNYWFAIILYRRYIRDGSEIMYAQNVERFGVRIRGIIYDITGNVTRKYKWIPWVSLKDSKTKELVDKKYINI